MLLKLREKTSGWIAGIIVGILIIPFAFFGVTDYFSAPAETWVARVGDAEISQQQFQSRFEEYRAQMRQTLGERYDGRLIERPETRQALLDRMVDEELLRQSAAAQGAIVPDAFLHKEIAAIPAFHLGGQFSVDQYRLLLSNQNMSPRQFEQRIQRDLEVRLMPQQIEDSAFATMADVDRYLALRDQLRDLRYLVVEAPEVDDEALPDEEVAAYYEANRDRYLSDELATIEYIDLDGAALDVPTVADEATLARRYEEQRNRFVEPEQRLASHILIKTAVDADADAQRAAQAQAQALVEQARAEGADFAALAREHSQDPGSRAGGGDLGWLERGITDPAFETALFGLDEGALSEPVKSSEGWHVIQLREVRAEKRMTLDEVRADLQREFLDTERERRYSDLAGQMVDALYRDPSTLETAARQVGLEIQTAGPFGRFGGVDPITSNPAVLEAAFSIRVLNERSVSDPIELGEARVIALRVIDFQPAEPIPLDDLRAQVETELRQERRKERAAERALQLFERLQAGETLDALAAELEIDIQQADATGRSSMLVDSAIVSAAFGLKHPAEGAVERAQVALGGDRYALVELSAVREGDPESVDLQTRTALRQQLAQMSGGAEIQAYLAALRKQIPVRMAPERM